MNKQQNGSNCNSYPLAKFKQWEGLIANCGIGKTEHLINSIIERLKTQDGVTKFIYAAPTIALARSFQERVIASLKTNQLMDYSQVKPVFTNEYSSDTPIVEQLELAINEAVSGDIILITHATMKIYGFETIKDGWSLAIDEVFNPLEIGFVEFKKSSKESEENLSKFLDVDNENIVSIKHSKLAEFKDTLSHMNELAPYAVKVGKWLTEDKFDLVWREEKESETKGKLVQYRGYRLDDLSKLERFNDVKILGANIELTAMNLILEKVFSIQIIDSPLIDYKEYQNSNNISVYPLYGDPNDTSFKYSRIAAETKITDTRNMNIRSMIIDTSENRTVKDLMINNARELMRNKRSYHMTNYREGENKDFILPLHALGERISPDSRGINSLRKCNGAVIIFNARPNPYKEISTINYIEDKYSIEKGQLAKAITYQRMHDTILQGAMRGNCRMDKGDKYTLCVPDMESALLFKQGAPDCVIDTSYMISPVRNKVGRPASDIDSEEFIKLIKQGLSETKIGKILGYSRPTIAKFRKSLVGEGLL